MTDGKLPATGDDVDRLAKELARGALRPALLAILEDGESYGYDLVARLRQGGGGLAVTEAAVYPLLKDFEAKGHLRSRWKATEDGVPPRKYYALTPAGARLLAGLRGAWKQHRAEMDKILGVK